MDPSGLDGEVVVDAPRIPAPIPTFTLDTANGAPTGWVFSVNPFVLTPEHLQATLDALKISDDVSKAIEDANIPEVTVDAKKIKPFDWAQFANDWWPGYALGTCIYQSASGGGCSGSGWIWAGIGSLPIPEGKVLQTGKVITKATAKALNELAGTDLARREVGRALESLKSDLGVPNDFHGKIMSNGDFVNSETGDVLGNILNYFP